MSAALDRRLAEITPANNPWTDAIRLIAAEDEVERQARRLDNARKERDAIKARLAMLPDDRYPVRSGGSDYSVDVLGDDVQLIRCPALLEMEYPTTDDAPTPDDIRRHGFASILPAEACCGGCERVKGGAA